MFTRISPERVSWDLPLRCRCGYVQGIAHEVGSSTGFRIICYCKDCQAFARFLRRRDMLDTAGGTDTFQMPAGRVKFTEGGDAVRCLCFSSKTYRWYTDCCGMPVGNTVGPRFSVVGLIHCFMDYEAAGCSLDGLLGPPLYRIHEHSASGPLPASGPGPPSIWHLARRTSRLFGWRVRGLERPNPFFDEHTQAPRSVPRLMTPNERAELYNPT